MRVRPRRRRMRLIVAGETPTAAALCWPVQRWRRRASRVGTVAAGGGLRGGWGREGFDARGGGCRRRPAEVMRPGGAIRQAFGAFGLEARHPLARRFGGAT